MKVKRELVSLEENIVIFRFYFEDLLKVPKHIENSGNFKRLLIDFINEELKEYSPIIWDDLFVRVICPKNKESVKTCTNKVLETIKQAYEKKKEYICEHDLKNWLWKEKTFEV